jgi:hypothetical protein
MNIFEAMKLIIEPYATFQVEVEVKLTCNCGCGKETLFKLGPEENNVGGLSVWSDPYIEVAIAFPLGLLESGRLLETLQEESEND